MRSPKPVTPDEAMAVWSSIPNPSARRVAKALNQADRRVHHSTIARWNAQSWRPVAHRPHLVEAARQALDFAAGVLTGDKAGGTKILEELHEREQLDDLSDREFSGGRPVSCASPPFWPAMNFGACLDARSGEPRGSGTAAEGALRRGGKTESRTFRVFGCPDRVRNALPKSTPKP